ncbi:MAG: hypothetical protein CM15mP3_00200 [Candidatus Poseidoniales archaeon]|nr:MAG: hypothetical protein CM15mP3_00200 [Candidatus Poseidoniales archaeon]
MTSEYTVRYTNTVLYDSHGEKHQGDFLIHDDGSWSNSNGDEDVKHVLDGSNKVITRSLQNWHTHLVNLMHVFLVGVYLDRGAERGPYFPPRRN